MKRNLLEPTTPHKLPQVLQPRRHTRFMSDKRQRRGKNKLRHELAA